MRLASTAADHFFGFIRDYDGELRGEKPLECYIHPWFESGDAVDYTGGQYAVYMQSILCIIQKLQDDPTLLYFLHREEGRIARSVGGIFYGEDWSEAECFDPHYFNEMVFMHYRCKYTGEAVAPCAH